jgi:hypothetical protein
MTDPGFWAEAVGNPVGWYYAVGEERQRTLRGYIDALGRDARRRDCPLDEICDANGVRWSAFVDVEGRVRQLVLDETPREKQPGQPDPYLVAVGLGGDPSELSVLMGGEAELAMAFTQPGGLSAEPNAPCEGLLRKRSRLSDVPWPQGQTATSRSAPHLLASDPPPSQTA